MSETLFACDRLKKDERVSVSCGDAGQRRLWLNKMFNPIYHPLLKFKLLGVESIVQPFFF